MNDYFAVIKRLKNNEYVEEIRYVFKPNLKYIENSDDLLSIQFYKTIVDSFGVLSQIPSKRIFHFGLFYNIDDLIKMNVKHEAIEYLVDNGYHGVVLKKDGVYSFVGDDDAVITDKVFTHVADGMSLQKKSRNFNK